jgi:hypothetical protein
VLGGKMNSQEFERLFIVLSRIADSLEAITKRLETIEGQMESCNDNLMSVSKNTW